jgi:glycosyltransferase involved in cell wall biosynthesis
VGRLSEEKGVELLLNASRHISCKIIVAGDGPLKNRLEDIPNVKFVGWQDKLSVQALMRKSSMLIFPSIWYEGMPMTILEAFSVGLPVVASRIGGIPEIVMDGENGLLFEPGDDIDLAMKINLLSSNLELQGRLSSEAQKKYEDTYSPAANYSKILPIYDTVISEKRQMR